ncbi:MAG TPA: efflux RND transporter periplasmic adaptor subunit [Pyrinomonadaceae bacterium]|jgi:multidrug efflux pump subunit AcrA (membrane-fusion protein)|nr:efflux RND transporter periplasmic adaptor subunit [Pyrinomonadaceae bacterium]
MTQILAPGAWTPFKLLLAIAAIAFVTSCGSTRSADRRGNSNANDASQSPTIAVTIGKTESRPVPAVIQATGSLVADETSNIAPKVAGKVANVMVNVGQFVGSGAVIAKIDDREPRLKLAEAQAGVKQSIAAVRQAEAKLGLGPNGKFEASAIPEVRAANANYEQALAEQRQAEANEKRYRELVETGDTPMITYEGFRTTRDTARSKTNAAKQQLDAQINTARQSNQAIASAEAAVEAAKTQVATAQQAVTDTVVRAPFAGFISDRSTAVGEYVTSSNTIATILRTNPIKIQIQIAEADVPQVAIGRSVSIQVDAYKDRNFAGTVTAVNPAVDTASRSAIVEASIENSDNALRTGMFATARINKTGGGTGVFAPISAVYNDQATQSYRAFVIVDGIAKLRVLQLGQEEGDSYQILDGLAADETVATSNLDQLYEGAKVSS